MRKEIKNSVQKTLFWGFLPKFKKAMFSKDLKPQNHTYLEPFFLYQTIFGDLVAIFGKKLHWKFQIIMSCT